MNAERPTDPREQMEVRITALLLGEASAFEEAELLDAIKADPELEAYYQDMRRMVQKVEEAVQLAPADSTADQPKLSDERRAKLEELFQKPSKQPIKLESPADRIKRLAWMRHAVAIAAAVVILVCVVGLLLPSLAKSKAKSARVSALNDLRMAELEARIEASENGYAAGLRREASDPKDTRLYRFAPGQSLPNVSQAQAVTEPAKPRSTAIYLPASDGDVGGQDQLGAAAAFSVDSSDQLASEGRSSKPQLNYFFEATPAPPPANQPASGLPAIELHSDVPFSAEAVNGRFAGKNVSASERAKEVNWELSLALPAVPSPTEPPPEVRGRALYRSDISAAAATPTPPPTGESAGLQDSFGVNRGLNQLATRVAPASAAPPKPEPKPAPVPMRPPAATAKRLAQTPAEVSDFAVAPMTDDAEGGQGFGGGGLGGRAGGAVVELAKREPSVERLSRGTSVGFAAGQSLAETAPTEKTSVALGDAAVESEALAEFAQPDGGRVVGSRGALVAAQTQWAMPATSAAMPPPALEISNDSFSIAVPSDSAPAAGEALAYSVNGAVIQNFDVNGDGAVAGGALYARQPGEVQLSQELKQVEAKLKVETTDADGLALRRSQSGRATAEADKFASVADGNALAKGFKGMDEKKDSVEPWNFSSPDIDELVSELKERQLSEQVAASQTENFGRLEATSKGVPVLGDMPVVGRQLSQVEDARDRFDALVDAAKKNFGGGFGGGGSGFGGGPSGPEKEMTVERMRGGQRVRSAEGYYAGANTVIREFLQAAGVELKPDEQVLYDADTAKVLVNGDAGTVARVNKVVEAVKANGNPNPMSGLIQAKESNTLKYDADYYRNKLVEDELNAVQLSTSAFEGLPLSEVVKQLNAGLHQSLGNAGFVHLALSTNSAPPLLDPATGAPVDNQVATDLRSVVVDLPATKQKSLRQLLEAIVAASDEPISYGVNDQGVVFQPEVKRVAAEDASLLSSLEPLPEISTKENPFSTFSLNVSDVSFQLAASSLDAGQLPDGARLRSEEFINAFDYRDPMPVTGQRVAFNWERARNPFAHNRELLRFSVQTAAAGREPGQALNLVLLLDNSGSMERADRVQITEQMLRVLAGQLTGYDRVSVITFARTPRLVVDGANGGNPEVLLRQVIGLNPDGGTNLEDALKLAYATTAKHYLANGNNRVIVITDGAANLGNVDPEQLRERVIEQRKRGIALDCFGVGWEGYNDNLLEQLSRNGDGRYGFLNDAETAPAQFASQLAGALQVAAADVKAQVEFNPNRVTVYRQIGYQQHQLTKEQFRDNTVDAAEIGAAEAGNALYSIEVNPNGNGPIGTFRVRYRVPSTGLYEEKEWVLDYSPAASELEASGPAMRLTSTAAAFAEWLANSPYAQTVTLDGLQNLLRGVPEAYAPDQRPAKLQTMIQQARSISGR